MGLKRCPVCQMSQDDKAIVCPCGHRFVTVVGTPQTTTQIPAWSPSPDPDPAPAPAPLLIHQAAPAGYVSSGDVLCFVGNLIGWTVVGGDIALTVDNLLKGVRTNQSLDSIPNLPGIPVAHVDVLAIIFGGLQGLAVGVALLGIVYIAKRVSVLPPG